MPVKLQWLVDMGLPRPAGNGLDILHSLEINRRPGAVGLVEACHLGRVLVTRNQLFRGRWEGSLAHPGIVILEDRSMSPEELSRNLLHLQFCLPHAKGHADTSNQRYVIKVDRAIFHVHQDGMEHEVESWKEPKVAPLTKATTPQFAGASHSRIAPA